MSTTIKNLVEMKAGDYERQIYVTIINSETENRRGDENRIYTTMDLCPTTLSALGFKIEGSRLGLGTDLYSGMDTLSEILGFDSLSEAMGQSSDYYMDNIYIKGN